MRYDKKKRVYLVVRVLTGRVIAKTWRPEAQGEAVDQLAGVRRSISVERRSWTSYASGGVRCTLYRSQDIKIKIVKQLPWVWSSVRISNTENRSICVLKILNWRPQAWIMFVYSGYRIFLRLSEFIYLRVQRPLKGLADLQVAAEVTAK